MKMTGKMEEMEKIDMEDKEMREGWSKVGIV
jgi:hypothetical protein